MKLTAITATRNRRALLARCIESVASQPYLEKEHIIVDGASTDGTIEFLEAASRMYPHLRWISETDSGLSEALNKGLRLATGGAVGIIGDDDFYEPGAFQLVNAEFGAAPKAGLVTGHCRLVRADESEIRVARAAYTNRRDLIECWRTWGSTVFIPAPGTFIRKAVIDKVGGFEEKDRYAMDYRHWIKIAEHFEIRIVDAVLANFRFDEGTISFSSEKKQQSETIAISKDYWGYPWTRSYFATLKSYRKHVGFKATFFALLPRGARR
jgi:glycosyltransferase involved in cell wall biosynthesis